MNKVCILAEKPSQAKAYIQAFKTYKKHDGYYEIERCDIFPEGAYLTWAYGHLVQLVEPSVYKSEWSKWAIEHLPIKPDEFKYTVSKSNSTQFDIVKSLMDKKDISTIIVGTDIDREGENIAWSIIREAKAEHKEIKRLWINSLEVDVIQEGFRNLKNGRDFYESYIEAQTRQVSDWLVGMNLSRLFTLFLQSKGVKDSFSVGRVQTPTLFMIYQRDNEIENFKAKSFYELIANVNHQNGKFTVKAEGRYEVLEQAIAALQKHQLKDGLKLMGEISKVTETNDKESYPRLYTLSSLQIKANKLWKYSPSHVLKIAQQLYEKKLLSYPRTSTAFITENEFAYILERVEQYQGLIGFTFPIAQKEPQKRYIDSDSVKEHYAIVPTKQIPTEKTLLDLTQEEKNIYLEVVKTTIAMFHEPYRFKKTLIEIDRDGLLFKTTGKVELSKGWKSIFPETANDSKDEQSLPDVSEGDPIQYLPEIKEGKTTKPKRLTEGDLIPLMIHAGKVLEGEDQAVLKETEGIGTEATRANIIETLKNQSYIEVKKNLVYTTSKGVILCEAVDGSLLASPALTAQWETFLRLIGKGERKQETFLKGIYQFIDKMMDEIPKRMNSESLVTSIKTLETQNYIGKCPSCSKGSIIAKEKFYVCSASKEGCKQIFSLKLLEKNITEVQLGKLLNKGKTDLIKGFKGKKPFDAYLSLIDDADKNLKKYQFNFK